MEKIPSFALKTQQNWTWLMTPLLRTFRGVALQDIKPHHCYLDLLALTFQQGQTLFVEQHKTTVRGSYNVTPEFEKVLQAARTRPDQEFVFESRLGGPYSYSGVAHIFRRAVKRAGVKNAVFHDIRRKPITDAKSQGRKPQEFSLHATEAEAEAYVQRVLVPLVEPLILPGPKK